MPSSIRSPIIAARSACPRSRSTGACSAAKATSRATSASPNSSPVRAPRALSPGEVTTLLESFLTRGTPRRSTAIRVDWAKWRQSFRGMQENPLLERIFAGGVESQETSGATSDWRLPDRSRRAGGTRGRHRPGRARSRRLGAAREAGEPARRSAAHRPRARLAHGRRNRKLARSRHRRRPAARRASCARAPSARSRP